MPVAVNLTGRKFGRWTALELSPDRDRYGKRLWSVVCDCGTSGAVRTSTLLRGGSKSCGCLAREISGAMAAARIGDAHPNWKGNEADYSTQHSWIGRRKPKSGQCSACGVTGVSTEWANISGEYKRDVSDYEELCISCHRRLDRQGNVRALMRAAFEAGQVGGQSFEVWLETVRRCP